MSHFPGLGCGDEMAFERREGADPHRGLQEWLALVTNNLYPQLLNDVHPVNLAQAILTHNRKVGAWGTMEFPSILRSVP
jgi:hypothetical protein